MMYGTLMLSSRVTKFPQGKKKKKKFCASDHWLCFSSKKEKKKIESFIAEFIAK